MEGFPAERRVAQASGVIARAAVQDSFSSINFDKPAADQAVSLAQRIVGLASEQFVDVVVVGKAEARTELEIVLTNSSGKAIAGSKSVLTLWPVWQFRSVGIRLPSASSPTGSMVLP